MTDETNAVVTAADIRLHKTAGFYRSPDGRLYRLEDVFHLNGRGNGWKISRGQKQLGTAKTLREVAYIVNRDRNCERQMERDIVEPNTDIEEN